MNAEITGEYASFRKAGFGFYAPREKRGLISVSGKEAVQFLNGLITNDVAKLEDGGQMRAAFPNAQGRLLALVRVLRRGGEFLFETEAATREKVFNNLFRFTFAGDFLVDDMSEAHEFFQVQSSNFKVQSPPGATVFQTPNGAGYFIPKDAASDFRNELKNSGAVEIPDALYEILRIENGEPLYGVDADETTIVPELGINGLISYNKGCYIGQEIIARIHFRGHIAKQLTGLILENDAPNGDELKSLDGKNAGRITSAAFSPLMEKTIALAFVRYDYLADGTQLKIGEALTATVKHLPFVS